MGGMDRIAALIGAVRAERGEDKVLLLDGGDAWQGSWTSLQTRAQDMVEVMSALKVDAMVGHWEFTYGADRVKEIADQAPFRISGPEYPRQTMAGAGVRGRKMFERGGRRSP
jgi:sulfur-oxidizing protein SoxB